MKIKTIIVAAGLAAVSVSAVAGSSFKPVTQRLDNPTINTVGNFPYALSPIEPDQTVLANFPLNKSTLSSEDQKKITAFADAVKQGRIAGVVDIEGYTDATGPLRFNNTLSDHRAAVVKKQLASAGVNTTSLRTQGFGPQNPIATSNTPDGRAQNRRAVAIYYNGGRIDQSFPYYWPNSDLTSVA